MSRQYRPRKRLRVPATERSLAPRSARGGGMPPLSNGSVARLLGPVVQRAAHGPATLDAAVVRTLLARRGQGAPLTTGVRNVMEPLIGAGLGPVRVHMDHAADELSAALRARAFTSGADIFFSRGAYRPGSPAGRRLLGHELAHVVQQRGGMAGTAGRVSAPTDATERQAAAVGRRVAAGDEGHVARLGAPAPAPAVQRDIIKDAEGNAVANEFLMGTELPEALVASARRYAARGALDDEALTRLRDQALRERGTVDAHERLFLAGLMDPANAAILAGTNRGADFQFPISSLTRARRDHVNDLGRELPAAVQAEQLALRQAVRHADLGRMLEQMSRVEAAATTAIVVDAGSFRSQAVALARFAEAHGISAARVLEAMVRAASDNSRGDRVLAGTVFAVAASTGHAGAGDLARGRIKVDALTPAAWAALPQIGQEVAAYVSVAQRSGLKGDTIYVQTALDIDDVHHRSVMIHELQHAADDAAAATGGITLAQRNQLEVSAYRTQAAFILEQLDGLPPATLQSQARLVAARMNDATIFALVLEAQADAPRHRPVVETIFSLYSPPPPASVVANLFGMAPAQLRKHMLTTINSMYGITDADRYPVDRLRGESALDL